MLHTTLTSISALPAAPDRLVLALISEGSAATFALPATGVITIGRAEDNDICLEDPLISRYHARIHLDVAQEIEDLGGTNGTRLSGVTIEAKSRVTCRIGQVIEVGSTLLVLQQQTRAAPARRLWPFAYFEMRLEDECRRGRGAKKGFSVLWISAPELDPHRLEPKLSELLLPEDVVGRLGDGEYAVLLPESTQARALEAQEEIARAFGADVRTGHARYPATARAADGLLEAARRTKRREDAGSEPIAEDEAMKDLFRMVDKVARAKISVLVLGETGTGKEVIAESIHRRSPRKDRPLLRLNCGALAESLLESELFGYEKGAFTGADQVKIGLIESADGGTVFLDEVGELPLSTQVKLLRALEQKEVMRLGSVTPKSVDVRFVAATNRNLEEEILKGHFRQDLYFRLAGVTLTIPPLRERPRDLERLAKHFAARAAEESGDAMAPAISDVAMRALMAYSWPGNIRELKNVIERAVLFGADGVIGPEHLPLEKMMATFIAPSAPLPLPDLSREEEEERAQMVRALEVCGGNQTRAAKLISMSVRTFVRKVGRYRLPRPKKDA